MKTYFAILLFTGAFILGAASAQQPTAKKPPVGVPADAKLFNGKWYRVYLEKKVSWHDAKRRCATSGGQLAITSDEPTWSYVRQLVKETAQGAPIWLGATHEQTPGVWQWIDGTPVKFTAWNQGKPDNAGKSFYMVAANGGWDDFPKNGFYTEAIQVVGFVCEWKTK